MCVQVVRYDLFSSAVFLPYFSMLILSLPLLGLGSKSTSLSPGFCVRRPRQYDTICWELNLISGFFAFFWLIVWADGINKCGWCLAGGRWCWLKGVHQIPSVSWTVHHSLHFHMFYIVLFGLGILCPLYCYYEWWGHGIGGVWLIHIKVWVGSQGLAIISYFVFICAYVFWSLVSCLFFKWVEHDSCCVCFFVYYLFSLFLVPLTRSYWSIEIVVPIM